MGNTQKCCSSATLAGVRKSEAVGGPEDALVLRPTKEFKAEYIERTKINPAAKVIAVQQRMSSQEYALRKLPMAGMPCQIPEELGKHCSALESLEHPHVCKFVEGFQDKNEVYLIYEKADAQTLFDYVKTEGKLKEQDAADYVRQVTMALKVAHSQKIYHGRLCASKIILALPMDDDEDDDNVQLKICDMGQVFILRPAPHEAPQTAKSLTTERYCVTPELAAGDLTSQQKPVYPAGVDKNDMWALGAIIYHLMTGSPPFQQCGDRQSLLDSVQNEVVEFTSAAWKKLSAEARDCVEMLLKINPSLRINAPTLLRHPWIQVAKTSFPKKRMVTLLKNLRLNADNCEFTRFVIRVIAEQLPTDGKQAETVESAYRCLDSDGDGILSVQELLKGLEKFLNLSQEEQKELFAMIDRDGSGTLNVSEFISATMDQRRAKSLPVLWQAFNAFDKDQSGSVTFDEIDAIVMELEGALVGKEQLREQCRDIRAELAAVSHDGTIDFDQFVYLLQQNNPTRKGAMKREAFRLLWSSCKVDCYEVRHLEAKHWDLSRVAMAASPRSAYRRRRKKSADDGTKSTDIKGGVFAKEENEAAKAG
mmetsp:Transcript_143238/g.260057  ORF Transcript_143238/g.260057 Transcript_143238/m.260057 type:complete len:592 (-) Transcript_143238:88-1863(-)